MAYRRPARTLKQIYWTMVAEGTRLSASNEAGSAGFADAVIFIGRNSAFLLGAACLPGTWSPPR